MSAKSSVSVRLDDDVKRILDVKRGKSSISEYVTSLIMNDPVESRNKSDVDVTGDVSDVKTDINDVKSDISDIKCDVKKLLSRVDVKSDVTKINGELRDEIRLGLIMFGFERDKRAVDKTKGNEMHWANWIQTKSPYPQDEKKIDAILDKLYMRVPVNPFLKKKR